MLPILNSSRFRAIAVSAAVAAAGCTQYKPMPLNDGVVNQRLASPSADQLRAAAKEFGQRGLHPVELPDPNGLTPDAAALMAVILSPELRAQRDQQALTAAQVIQAGILPNPQISFNEDIVTGGTDQGSINAYLVGLSWDVAQLLSHDARVNAARAQLASVSLNIAWQEWQTAMAAQTAVWDLVALQSQLQQAQTVDRLLAESLDTIRAAVDRHDRTILDLSAAEAASQDAHAVVLQQEQALRHQMLMLNRTIGLPPDTQLVIRNDVVLPSQLALPSSHTLLAGLDQRVDLLALRRGYQSQEETLRAAVINQFPKINLGFNKARDNTNVKSFGAALSIDLPLFDRNQGVIATETATRKQLFDEYIQRVFEARSDVALALDDITSVQEQIAADEAALPSDQRFADTYRDAFEKGNTDINSYYLALTNLSQRKINLIKLKQQLAEDGIALEIATGHYLPAQAAAPTTQEAK